MMQVPSSPNSIVASPDRSRMTILDPESQESVVWLNIQNGVEVQDDAIAAIRTAGIIGDKFIKISVGGGIPLEDGEEIIETEPAISVEELISKYLFDN